jgi:hypothetical protein
MKVQFWRQSGPAGFLVAELSEEHAKILDETIRRTLVYPPIRFQWPSVEREGAVDC